MNTGKGKSDEIRCKKEEIGGERYYVLKGAKQGTEHGERDW